MNYVVTAVTLLAAALSAIVISSTVWADNPNSVSATLGEFHDAYAIKGDTQIGFYATVTGGNGSPITIKGGVQSNNSLTDTYNITGQYACDNVSQRMAMPPVFDAKDYDGETTATCPDGATTATVIINLQIH